MLPWRTWSLGDSTHWRWLLWLDLTDPLCDQPLTGHVSVTVLPHPTAGHSHHLLGEQNTHSMRVTRVWGDGGT